MVNYATGAGLGAAAGGFVSGMLAAGNGLGRWFVCDLSDRFGRRRVLAAV